MVDQVNKKKLFSFFFSLVLVVSVFVLIPQESYAAVVPDEDITDDPYIISWQKVLENGVYFYKFTLGDEAEAYQIRRTNPNGSMTVVVDMQVGTNSARDRVYYPDQAGATISYSLRAGGRDGYHTSSDITYQVFGKITASLRKGRGYIYVSASVPDIGQAPTLVYDFELNGESLTSRTSNTLSYDEWGYGDYQVYVHASSNLWEPVYTNTVTVSESSYVPPDTPPSGGDSEDPPSLPDNPNIADFISYFINIIKYLFRWLGDAFSTEGSFIGAISDFFEVALGWIPEPLYSVLVYGFVILAVGLVIKLIINLL